MVMKNKLRKHNKSKSSLIMRQISIATLSISSVIAIVAIPTYINIRNQMKLADQTASVAKPVEESKINELFGELKSVVNN